MTEQHTNTARHMATIFQKPYNNPRESEGFFLFNRYWGLLVDDGEGSLIYGFDSSNEAANNAYVLPGYGGSFGYVNFGTVLIKCHETKREIEVQAGMWFSVPGACTLEFSHNYSLYICQRRDYPGALAFGLVERTGRLKYIDGAFDTLLHPPIKKGLPCFNALYMPTGIHQTMHTHPSTRAGFIIIGGATCETPDGKYRLESGDIFYLRTNGWHKFRSDLEDSSTMMLVAYHPDSDFGPTDEDHPMLNRTIVNGVSAKDMPEIQTK